MENEIDPRYSRVKITKVKIKATATAAAITTIIRSLAACGLREVVVLFQWDNLMRRKEMRR